MGELPGIRAGVVGYDLAFAEELPLIDYQAVEADGAAGVDFVGADADFGAQAVLVAVAEARVYRWAAEVFSDTNRR